MSNPFDGDFGKKFADVFSGPAFRPVEPYIPEAMSQEIDEENRIVIPCAVCGKGVSRSSVILGNPFVHVDDALRIPPSFARSFISTSDYDHEAVPDVLDCESWEDTDAGLG